MPWPASSLRELVLLAQPVGEDIGGHRPPQQEALGEVTTEGLQLGPDGLGLDPLGDDRDPELVSEVDRGPDDRPEARIARYRPYQGHVELEFVNGPAAEALQ